MVDLLTSIDEIANSYRNIQGASANTLIQRKTAISYSDLMSLYNGIAQDSELNGNADLWKLWRACYVNSILLLPYNPGDSQSPSFNIEKASEAFENLDYLSTRYRQKCPKAYDRLISRISEAINNSSSIEEFIQWAKLAKNVNEKLGADINYVKSLVSIKSKTLLYKNCSSGDKNNILQNLQNLWELKNLEISVDDAQNIAVDSALAWIEEINDLKKFKEYRGEAVNPDPETSKAMLRIIKQLTISEERTQVKINRLIDIFPDNEPVEEEIPEIEEPEPVYITRRREITMKQAIFKYGDKSVYLCGIMWNGQQIDAAIKTYKDANPDKYRGQFEKEVEILRKTSGRGRFFLDYYGSFVDQVTENGINKYCYNVLMEYCPQSLSDLLKAKKQSTEFSQGELYNICIDMLEAFKSLAKLKIYHQDIKPDNILVTKDGQLKIADFNVSGIAEIMEETYSPTVENNAIGTPPYMSPELKTAYINGIKKIKYKLEKSDVFSLGLVFYQCATLGDISRFNEDKRNREKVLKEIEVGWLKNLIYEMLDFDYQKRPSFRRLLKHMKRDTTQAQD